MGACGELARTFNIIIGLYLVLTNLLKVFPKKIGINMPLPAVSFSLN